MRALLFERNVARFAAARMAALAGPGLGARPGPLRLTDLDSPALPGPGWHRIKPVLSGICGSDLALLDGHTSRYFEPLVSFPFVPGHEVVGVVESGPRKGERVVVEPLLSCAVRGIDPPCRPCASGHTGCCENTAFGQIKPGPQTGYCASTGGGWSTSLVANDIQLHPVPSPFSNEDAVMIEPTSCAVHAGLSALSVLCAGYDQGSLQTRSSMAKAPLIVILGAGTLGLCTVAALSYALKSWLFTSDVATSTTMTDPRETHAGKTSATDPATEAPSTSAGELATDVVLMSVAKHPVQKRFAAELGASVVVEPGELRRAVRRFTGSLALPANPRRNPDRLTAGADVVVDCVGSASSLEESFSVVRPGGSVVLLGMPGKLHIDLTALWHREIRLVGAYAYGLETLPGAAGARRKTFDLATELVKEKGLGRLVSAKYPIERYEEAVHHAATAGRRGAVKVVFDLEPASYGLKSLRQSPRSVRQGERP